MAKDRTRVLQKYQTRVSQSGPEYAAGVATPKRDWLAAYKASQPRMAAGIQAALAAGKPAKMAEQKGGTANWQSKAADKGSRNYANAAADAAKGYDAKLDKVLAAGATAQAAVASMPNVTQQDRINRMIKNAQVISDQWKK